MTTVKSLDLLSPLREPSSTPGKQEPENEEKPTPERAVASRTAEPRSVRARFQGVLWDPSAPEAGASSAEEELNVGTVRERFRSVHWKPLPPEAIVDEGLSKEEVEERAAEHAARKSVRSVFARMK